MDVSENEDAKNQESGPNEDEEDERLRTARSEVDEIRK